MATPTRKPMPGEMRKAYREGYHALLKQEMERQALAQKAAGMTCSRCQVATVGGGIASPKTGLGLCPDCFDDALRWITQRPEKMLRKMLGRLESLEASVARTAAALPALYGLIDAVDHADLDARPAYRATLDMVLMTEDGA